MEKSWKGQHAGHASTSSQHPASTTTPMEIDSFKKIEKLTPETRAQCIKEGRCLFCREPGHIVVNCPKKNKINPNGQRQ